MTLRQIAEATGGQAFFPSAMKDVESAYDKVLAEIKGQYHLGYLSTNTAKDGAWRKVDIRVKRPDLRVRARKGYFGPTPAREHPERYATDDTMVCYGTRIHAFRHRSLQPRIRLRASRRPGPRRTGAGRWAEPRRQAPGAARRHRLGQDLQHGAGDLAREPADAGDGAQQDPGRAAVPGVPAVLP